MASVLRPLDPRCPRRCRLLVLLTGATLLQAAPGELGRPVLRNYPPGEHLAGQSSHTLVQDEAGWIYFANEANVLIHDGAQWSGLALPTESAGIRQFAVAADGRIYAGGAGVLGYLEGSGRQARFVSLADRLPAAQRNIEEVRQAVAGGDTVYFADAEKILAWRGERFTVLPYPVAPGSPGARLHRAGDAVYVTAPGRPLGRLRQDRLEVVSDDDFWRENQITALAPGPTPGSLAILASGKGFFDCDAQGRVTRRDVEANGWLAGRRLFRAQCQPDGSWAVALAAAEGEGGMLIAADGKLIGPLGMKSGLHTNGLRDFVRDREGGLWLGLVVGATRLQWPSAVSVFDVFNGLGQGGVTAMARHRDRLYAATTEGVFRLEPPRDTRHTAHFERWLDFPTQALLAHRGSLLIATMGELRAWDGDVLTTIRPLPPGEVRLVPAANDAARVWIATTDGVFAVRRTETGWQDEGGVSSLREDLCGLVSLADGTLWGATTARGFFRAEIAEAAPGALGRATVRITRFKGGDGLPERPGRGDVALWEGVPVFTVEGAPTLFRHDAGRRRFEPLEIAPENPVGPGAGRVFGTGGALWLAGPEAIRRVAGGGVAAWRLPHYAVVAAGGVTHLGEEADQSGRVLWICGAKGLVRVALDEPMPPPPPLLVQLESPEVRADQALPPEHAPLNFRYLAIRQQRANTVLYRTRLAGRERDWSAWAAKRERYFPHLTPGRYVFEVQARDADGVESGVSALSFRVLPPWWLSWWALLGYAAAGGAGVFGAVHHRTRALRHRAARLERVVAERTAELEQKNRELTRLNQLEFDEKVAARLAEEKARLEVLRYQLNPHFLFNALASISGSLPAGGPARGMVERLAEFCRLTLHRADEHGWTTLGDEMRLLRAYLAIEQSRWADLLAMEVRHDPALDAEPLPYFLLLPLVENALKYGRDTSPDRVGIRLATRRTGDGGIAIEVANTGEWVEPAAEKTVATLGIGLENLRQRLARHYPGAHRLEFAAADGWVTARLHLAAPARRAGAAV